VPSRSSIATRAPDRNPRTSATAEVSRKVIPFFKTGKQLSERLNGGLN